MNINDEDFSTFLRALQFAARKHGEIDQHRKGRSHMPYINHPISVAEVLWRAGGVRDITTLVAALLHDTIEDTHTTREEVREQFGEEVLSLVLEVTDDKSLDKAERKHLQITHAGQLSPRARQLKLGDKINNVYEIAHDPPEDWPMERREQYLDWTKQVIDGLRGQNPGLEAYYDEVLAEARKTLEEEKRSSQAKS